MLLRKGRCNLHRLLKLSPRNKECGVAKEQNSAFLLKSPVGIMYYALSCCQADLIKVLPAINAGRIAISLNLVNIEPFQF